MVGRMHRQNSCLQFYSGILRHAEKVNHCSTYAFSPCHNDWFSHFPELSPNFSCWRTNYETKSGKLWLLALTLFENKHQLDKKIDPCHQVLGPMPPFFYVTKTNSFLLFKRKRLETCSVCSIIAKKQQRNKHNHSHYFLVETASIQTIILF